MTLEDLSVGGRLWSERVMNSVVHRRVLVGRLFGWNQQREPFLGACTPDFVYLITERPKAVV